MKKGYVHIYTGDGKGKTTAALGLALRACGRGFSVYIGQFMKGQYYGELTGLNYLPGVEFDQFGDENCITREQVTEDHKRQAAEGIDKIYRLYGENSHDIIILDEIIVAVWFGIVTEETLIELIRKKPEKTELVLTGRKASKTLMEHGDLITEMKEIRHYYATLGITARKGIEN